MWDNPTLAILIILGIAGFLGKWMESWVDKRVRRGIEAHEARFIHDRS